MGARNPLSFAFAIFPTYKQIKLPNRDRLRAYLDSIESVVAVAA